MAADVPLHLLSQIRSLGDKEFASSHTLQRSAAFLMALGPGSGGGFYTAMSGFYIAKFNDRSFLIAMLLCYCTPGPIVSLLQHYFDALFDEKFTTRTTYGFRVIVMQLLLGCLVVAWMFCHLSSGLVLGIGCLLGFVCFSILSSSLQMVAASDPTHIINAKLGLQLGGMLPIVVFLFADFTPSSSHQEATKVLSSVVCIAVLAACILGYFHLTSDLFTKAYERLSYDLTSTEEGAQEDNRVTDPLLGERSFERQTTATAALDPAAEHGIPSWVRYWQGCNGLVTGITWCLAALAGYFGDSSLAQTLVLLKLLMEFIGRTVSFAIPCVPGFTDGPWHKVMVGNMILVLGLGGVCWARLFGLPVAHVTFLISWCGLFALTVFSASLVDVTTGSYVSVRDRKAVARTNQLVIVSSVLFGLIVAKAISMAHLD